MDVHRSSIPGQPLKFGDCSVTFIVDTSKAIRGLEPLVAKSIQSLISKQLENPSGTFKYRLYGAGYRSGWLDVQRRVVPSLFISDSHTTRLCDAFQSVYQEINYDERNVIVALRLSPNDDSGAVSCERRTTHFLGHSTNQVLYVGANHDTNFVSTRYGVPRTHTLVCGVPTLEGAIESCSNSISRLRVLADLYNAKRAASVTAFDSEDRQKAFPEGWRGNEEFHNKIGKLDDFHNAENWKLNAAHQRFAI